MDKALKPTKADLEGLKTAGEALLASSQKTGALCDELAADDKTSPQFALFDDAYVQEMIASCDRFNKARARDFYNSTEYQFGFEHGKAAATQALQPQIDKLQAQVEALQAQLDKGPVRNDAVLLKQQGKDTEGPKSVKNGP